MLTDRATRTTSFRPEMYRAFYDRRFETREQRLPLFHAVENPDHWKNPVNAFLTGVPNADVEKVASALCDTVIYFTGSVPKITPTPGPIDGWTTLHVVADGYYKAVGA